MNLLTIGYIAGGFFTRNDPNSFFKPIGIALKPAFILVAILIGLALGFASSSAWFVSLLKPAAGGAAVSPTVVTQVLFNNFIAPFSETYFISGFLTPLAFLIVYAILKQKLPNFAALFVAGAIAITVPAAILTVFHLVVDASNLGQLPLIFVFFTISDMITLLSGEIVVALMMHWGLNLVVPGIIIRHGETETPMPFIKMVEKRLDNYANMQATKLQVEGALK